MRLFVLPKTNTPQTLVVVSLDPPIRKGQTYYPHILCQFSNDEELSVELDLTEEQVAAKNERVSGVSHHRAPQDMMLGSASAAASLTYPSVCAQLRDKARSGLKGATGYCCLWSMQSSHC